MEKLTEAEIIRRYNDYCQSVINEPIDSDYEPISYEQYKAVILKLRVPSCK